MEFIKYNSSLPYSYVFGAFGTIELLMNKTRECLSVIIDPSFVKNEAYQKIESICKKNNIPIIIDLKLINKIRDKGNIFVVGVFNKYKSSLSSKKHLVLYDIDDVGIIGTIIRSMRGFSFENLVLINCNIDLYHEHLIRSTMGAFFQTNIKEYNNIEEYKIDYPDMELVNISNTGDNISRLNQSDNLALIFSKKAITDKDITNFKFKEDISLDNIVNIILFTLYPN